MIELRAAVMLMASVSALVLPRSCTVTRVTLNVPLRGAVAAAWKPSPPASDSAPAEWSSRNSSPSRGGAVVFFRGSQSTGGTKEVTSSSDAAEAEESTVGDGDGADVSSAGAAGSSTGAAGSSAGAAGSAGGSAGAGAGSGSTMAGAEDGAGAGTGCSAANAGSEVVKRALETAAAHSNLRGVANVTGFSSRIRASARWANFLKTTRV